jgi:uncharacterized membrane protein YgdD (TMEM256/DUF423 family)
MASYPAVACYDGGMRMLGILGSTGLLLGVALGAFAAHGLKQHLSESAMNTFETGVRYQMYHSLAILIAALFSARTGNLFQTAGYFYVSGILLFSFSLYLLAWSGMKWLGAITPFGGLCFLAGHAILLYAFVKTGQPSL